ncbi:type I restriction endonuclease subunit R [Bacillus arachidis]|uniref:type I restriction endonuclease subunit R n=1 Tax=Bacillus arachidis TaxID=2819290 RepID=UPI00255C2D0B|nr:type I restriction endonuclease subunit R [Bacillus arachidis]WIY58985.1 type I restriction endonuclease subunit R [Bacillus arachidis]
MSKRNESTLEYKILDMLEEEGYQRMNSTEFHWKYREQILLRDRFLGYIERKYPEIPNSEHQRVLNIYENITGFDVMERNVAFHRLLTKGEYFHWEENGEKKSVLFYPVDWDDQENDWLVVNQWSITGVTNRRPDVVIFLNGLPIIMMELKNPYNENVTIEEAYQQMKNYTHQIPRPFTYQVFSVISDGISTKHGMIQHAYEFFAEWKSIDGKTIENNPLRSASTLVHGLLNRKRLLLYIRNFVMFLETKGKRVKIGAKYHQFYGMLKAYEKIKESYVHKKKKIGVVWHTQGSGKSISMVFLAHLLLKDASLKAPTIVVQVDRIDLDDQLYETFLQARELVPDILQAQGTEELRYELRNAVGKVIFTTIEKFRLKEVEGTEGKVKEEEHPLISEADNIIIFADEAHRTQYGGYGDNMKKALPNAMRIAFTGTPIDAIGRSTTAEFGELIDVYDMEQAVQDGATVPIYYLSRHIPLNLDNQSFEEELRELLAENDTDEDAFWKKHRVQWKLLEKITGHPNRQKELAENIVAHFNENASSFAKGMIVCMSRQNAVSLLNIMRALPNAPQVEIIISGSIAKDNEAWYKVPDDQTYPIVKSKEQQDEIKQRLRDPEDPLKMIIVCDMWLTGFDAKPVTYLYVDKPMKGHNLMQAVARVNRLFPDKTGGVIVDYIHISEALKQATKRYTEHGGEGQIAEDLHAALEKFQSKWTEFHSYIHDFWNEEDTRQYLSLKGQEKEDGEIQFVNGFLNVLYEEEAKLRYFTLEKQLYQLFVLVKSLEEVESYKSTVYFYREITSQLRKILYYKGGTSQHDLVKAMEGLMDKHIEATGTVDLLKALGIEAMDVSILNETFLASAKEDPTINTKGRLLQRLLQDEVESKIPNGEGKSNLQKKLQRHIDQYNKGMIDAVQFLELLKKMKEEFEKERDLYKDFELTDDEMMILNVLTEMKDEIFTIPFLAELTKAVVKEIKGRLDLDWTKPHKASIYSGISFAIRATLLRHQIKGEQLRFYSERILDAAKECYENWGENERSSS